MDFPVEQAHIAYTKRRLHDAKHDLAGAVSNQRRTELGSLIRSLERTLQQIYVNINNPEYSRQQANFHLSLADLALKDGRPNDAYLHAGTAREHRREYQRLAEAQRELTRGLRSQVLPPAPRPPEEEPGRPRHIPSDVIRHIHAYGYGAVSAEDVRRAMHARHGGSS